MKFLREEHIGEEVIVENKKTGKLIQGKIIDETKNTYLIRINKKQVMRIIKEKNYIIFINHNLKIDGSKLTKRPEDRIKMKD